MVWDVLTAIGRGTEIVGTSDAINTERVYGDVHAAVCKVDGRHTVAHSGGAVRRLVFHGGRITNIDGTRQVVLTKAVEGWVLAVLCLVATIYGAIITVVAIGVDRGKETAAVGVFYTVCGWIAGVHGTGDTVTAVGVDFREGTVLN